MNHTGIQVVICATKYDCIRSQDVAVKNTLSKALRCVAHANGAHLVYSGVAGPKQGQADKMQAEEMQKKLRALFMHTLFSGHDRKLCDSSSTDDAHSDSVAMTSSAPFTWFTQVAADANTPTSRCPDVLVQAGVHFQGSQPVEAAPRGQCRRASVRAAWL